MLLKGVQSEDFTNYKKAAMFLIFPHCDFKCDKENGSQLCQNLSLVKQPNIDIPIESIVSHYINNNITRAIVCGGLEPMKSFTELLELIRQLREKTMDPIIIYTGHTESELNFELTELKKFDNIIIKFGRYHPNQKAHFDDVLGIYLASDNQYAKKIS